MPPNSTFWDITIAAGFLLGVALLIVSSAMLRSTNRERSTIAWPRLVDEGLAHADAALRLDMIERLSLVPGDWSRQILEQALREEKDDRIRSAIDNALLS